MNLGDFDVKIHCGRGLTHGSHDRTENIMHRKRTMLAPLLLAPLLLVVVACEETDVVAIRVLLDDPTSGTIVVNSLQAPPSGGPVESTSQGVDWQQRMNLVCASGRFSTNLTV